jgi:drug/metabolite transporter (DMT)-like permease
MSETSRLGALAQSIAALFAGFVVVVALSLGADVAMHKSGIFPPWGTPMSDGLFLLATVYRVAYGVIGSYVTARVAPDRPMRHAMIGGVIGLAISILGAVTTWDRGPEFGPHWYPVALAMLALPQSWVGGMLRERQLQAAD